GTPADIAFNERNIAAGIAFLNAGAEVKPEYLVNAITSQHSWSATTNNILELIEILDARGALDEHTLKAGFDQIVTMVKLNGNNIPDLAPVLETLIQQGVDPDAENLQIAAEI